MNKLTASSRYLSSGLFALIAVGAASAAAAGCAKADEEKKQASWTCTRDEVPMGEVVRCSTSALTADGPTTTTTGGTTDGTTTTDGTLLPDPTAPLPTAYNCSGDYVALDCPPVGATGGDGSDPVGTSSGSTSGGTTGSSGTSGGGTSSSGGGGGNGASSGGNGNSSGNSGHTTDGTGPNGSNSGGTTNGGGGSSHARGPDECSWVPDLDYCGGAGGGGGTSDGTTSSGTSSSSSGGTGSGSDCTKSNCDVPGQTKKDGTSSSSGGTSGATSSGGTSSSGGTTDGTSSSSSGGASSSGASRSSGGASSSGGGSGGGGHKSWDCTKDDKGNRICVSTPDCAPGTHASACGACVDNSDASGGDCVPPTEGGCWITGGGFIEGASLTPAAPADGKDNFGGNAKPMKKGGVSGHWNHVDHGTGNHAKGRPEYIMCRVTDGPGPKQPGGKKGLVVNQVYFGGHAQWREAAAATWSDGYWFDVVAEDHGEPGNTSAIKNGAMPDSYHFTIRKMDDPAAKVSGAIVYETRDDLRGGNIQIHPSNPGHPAVSSPLPGWVSLEQ